MGISEIADIKLGFENGLLTPPLEFCKYNPLLTANYNYVEREKQKDKTLRNQLVFDLSSREYDVWNALFSIFQGHLKENHYSKITFGQTSSFVLRVRLSELASLVYPNKKLPANYTQKISDSLLSLQKTQIILKNFWSPKPQKGDKGEVKIVSERNNSEAKDFQILDYTITSPILEYSYDSSTKTFEIKLSHIIALCAWYSKDYTRLSIIDLNSLKNKYSKMLYEWLSANKEQLRNKDVKKNRSLFDEDKEEDVVRVGVGSLQKIFRNNIHKTCGAFINAIGRKTFLNDMRSIYPKFDYEIDTRREEVIIRGLWE